MTSWQIRESRGPLTSSLPPNAAQPSPLSSGASFPSYNLIASISGFHPNQERRETGKGRQNIHVDKPTPNQELLTGCRVDGMSWGGRWEILPTLKGVFCMRRRASGLEVKKTKTTPKERPCLQAWGRCQRQSLRVWKEAQRWSLGWW